ncbi:hypothetical protein Glove_117g118 [Diversispora epigaea]|uniref:Uncharacterized protein n=1 Tax=Diversispora epigaea TaxID=1348612 RepID=A0A397JA44_9GLOM|nr:hypothetical protein Glove_117g118 [Diversispora epigaea]
MDMKVTEESLDDVRKNIEEASDMLQIACSALRSCFTVNSSSVKSFVELRTEVTNEARFKEYLPELADESNKNVEICNYTLELHKAILVDFKKKEENVTSVLNQLGLEANEFEESKNALLKSAKIKYCFAIGLFWLPYAPRLFISDARKDTTKAIAASEEKLLAVAAIDAIKNSLSISIANFVKSISKIAGFFKVLTSELTMLAEDHQDAPKKMHYQRIRKKALPIVNYCRRYLSEIPESEAELLAIPENFDKNYVQEWLSKREAEIDNEMITFANWGKRLFTYNKKLYRLITTE